MTVVQGIFNGLGYSGYPVIPSANEFRYAPSWTGVIPNTLDPFVTAQQRWVYDVTVDLATPMPRIVTDKAILGFPDTYTLHGLHFRGAHQATLQGIRYLSPKVDPISGSPTTGFTEAYTKFNIGAGGLSNLSPHQVRILETSVTTTDNQEWVMQNAGLYVEDKTVVSHNVSIVGSGDVVLNELQGSGNISWLARAGYGAPGVLKINDGGAFTGTINTGTAANAGTLTFNGPRYPEATPTAFFSGQITGEGTVTHENARTSYIGSAVNTHTGLTWVKSGLLDLARSGTNTAIRGDLLIEDGRVRLSVSNQIANSSQVKLVKGELELGTYSDWIGNLELHNSRVTSTGQAQLVLGGNVLSTPSNVNGQSVIEPSLRFSENVAVFNVLQGDVPRPEGDLVIMKDIGMINGTLIKRGNGTLFLNSTSNVQSLRVEEGEITVTQESALGAAVGTAVVLDGGSLRFANGFGAYDAGRTLTVGGSGGKVDTGLNNITVGPAVMQGTSRGLLTKVGVGQLSLSGLSALSGVDVQEGGLVIHPGAGLAGNAGGGQNLGSVKLSGGYLQFNGGKNYVFESSQPWHLAGADATTRHNVIFGSGELDIRGNISGKGELFLSGHTVRLSGTNGWTGKLSAQVDTLRLGSPGALAGVNELHLFGGKLALDASVTYAGSVTIPHAAQFDTNGNLLHLTGDLVSESGAQTHVVKQGLGELRVTGAKSTAFHYRVDAGTLSFDKAAAEGSLGQIDLENGGTLKLLGTLDMNSQVISYAQQKSVIDTGAHTVRQLGIIGGAQLTKIGTGTLRLENNSNAAGLKWTVEEGWLEIERQQQLGEWVKLDGGGLRTIGHVGLDIDLQPLGVRGGSLDVPQTLDLVRPVTGVGDLTKLGAGALALTMADYTGTLKVQQGSVRLGISTSDFSPAGIENNGKVFFQNSTDQTLSAVLRGSGEWVKDGGAELMLTGQNLFTGPLSVRGAGTLTLASESALGMGGTVELDGGRLRVKENLELFNNRSLTLTGAGNSIDVDAGNTLTFWGSLKDGSQMGSLVKQGAGTLFLGGANSFSGSVEVQGGALVTYNPLALRANNDVLLGANRLEARRQMNVFEMSMGRLTTAGGTLSVESDMKLNVTGGISGGDWTKQGAGTAVIGGTNSAGAITVSGGMLTAAHADAFAGTGAITVAAHAGIGADVSATVGTSRPLTFADPGVLNVKQGATLTIESALNASTLVLNGSGTVQLNGATNLSGMVHLGAGTLAGRVSNLQANFSTAPATTLRLNQAVDRVWNANVAGQGSLELVNTQSTFGVIRMGPGYSHSHTGHTIVGPNLYLVAAAAGSLSGSSTYVVDGALDLHGGSQTLGGLAGNGLLYSYSTVPKLSTLTVGANGATTSFSGVIADNSGYPVDLGQVALVKTGYGMLTLSGANTFSGGVKVMDGGVLRIMNTAGLGSSQNIRLENGGLRFGSSLTLPSSIGVTLEAAGSSLQTDAGTRAEVASIISGGWGLAASGSGTIVLSGANTFSGGLRVNSGTVEFTTGTNLGTGSVTLDGGGLRWGSGSSLDVSGRLTPLGVGGASFDTSGNVSFATALSGPGGLTKRGVGTLTLGAVPSYLGMTTVQEGRLVVAGSGGDIPLPGGLAVSTGAEAVFQNSNLTLPGLGGSGGQITLSSGRLTLDVPTGNTYSYGGVVSNTGGVMKTGGGTQVLSGANSFTGGLQIQQGVLAVSSDSGLGAAGESVHLDGGTLRWQQAFAPDATREIKLLAGGGTLDVGSHSIIVSQSIQGTGPLVKAGPGTLALAGTSAFSSIRVDGGLLAGPSTALKGDIQVSSGARMMLFEDNDSAWNANLSGAGQVQLIKSSANNLNVLRMQPGNTHRQSGATLVGPDIFLVSGDTNSLSPTSAYNVLGHLDLGGRDQTIGSLAGSGRVYSFSTSNAATTLTAGGDGSSSTFSGTLADSLSANQGNLALVKVGAGTLTLSGNSTFTGGIALRGGAVSFQSQANLGTGAITLEGGTLEWRGSHVQNMTSSISPLTASGGTFRTVNTGAELAFSAAPTGSGDLIKEGDGNLSFGTLLRHTGDTFIHGGYLRTGFGSNISATYAGNIHGGSSGTFHKRGTGGLTLTGTGHTFTGQLLLEGELKGSSQTLPAFTQITNYGSLIFDQITDGDYHLKGYTGFGKIEKSGMGKLSLTETDSSAARVELQSGVLELQTSNFQVTVKGGELRWGANIPFSGNNTILDPGSQTVNTQGYDVMMNLFGEGSLLKKGSGTLRLANSGTANWEGSTTISEGTLAASTVAFGYRGRLISLDAGTLLHLDQTGIPDHGLRHSTNGAGRLILANTTPATLAVVRAENFVTLRHSGSTEIGTGVALVLNSSGSLSPSSSHVVDGILDLGGHSQTIRGLSGSGLIYSAIPTNTAAQATTLTVNQQTDSLYTGTIVDTAPGNFGTLALVKTGPGTLTFTRNHRYSGGLTITSGAIAFQNVNSGNTDPLLLNGGSTTSDVTVASTATVGGSGTIRGNVSLNAESGAGLKNGGRIAPDNSLGVLTVTGATTLNAGSIFAWAIDTSNSTQGRGSQYSGLNTDSVSGTSDAVFQIVIGGSQGFADHFWKTNQSWTDIFKNDTGTTNLTNDWSTVFSSFAYSNGTNAIMTPSVYGSFSWTTTVNSGDTLTWSAVPEPSGVVSGLLIAAGFLRRRRSACEIS